MMVFIYHYRKYWMAETPGWLLRPQNEFHTGVSIFFVLSGFLIAYTYGERPSRTVRNYTQYILIRLARIFPVYLLLLTIKYLDNGFPTGNETWLNYSLFKGFSDRLNLTGIPQSWTLTVELCFYFLAPIIYIHSIGSLRKTVLYLLLLLVVTLGIGYGWHAYNGNKDDFFYDWFFVLNTTFMGRFPEFLFGILLAHGLMVNIRSLPFLKIRSYTLAGGLFMLASIIAISLFEKTIFTHGTDHPAGLFIRNVLLPFFTAQFLYGLITERTAVQWFLSTRLMVLLGNASYIFYLLHIGYFSQFLERYIQLKDHNFILLWVCSVILYLVIEHPVYEFFKRLIRRI